MKKTLIVKFRRGFQTERVLIYCEDNGLTDQQKAINLRDQHYKNWDIVAPFRIPYLAPDRQRLKFIAQPLVKPHSKVSTMEPRPVESLADDEF